MQVNMGNDEAAQRATALILELRRICIAHTDSLSSGNALYVALSATIKLIAVLGIEVLEHENGRTPTSEEVTTRLMDAPCFDNEWVGIILKEHLHIKEKS
jgi:hypothetical protein